ncbi:MAG: hypothetical protein U9N56_08820 [Actinomycetota bacterium]|nr:hypothetical protein [Actinomycetota bacterium]
MTQNDAEWKRELEESAQGTDLFEAPGSAIQNEDARQSAVDWDAGDPERTEGSANVEEARARRHSLQAAMSDLESAVASPSGADGWYEGVSIALDEMRKALAEHVAVTEGPGGLLEEILAEAPRLATEIALTKSEHEELAVTLDKADLTAKGALEMEAPDSEPVRRRVMLFLSRLSLHRQRGADLVYDAYNVDIATGD